MTVTVNAQSGTTLELDGQSIDCGELTLTPGQHILRTQSEWVTLTESVPAVPVEGLSAAQAASGISAAPTDRTLSTTRAFNPGTTAFIGETQLSPIDIAGSQGFHIPAGLSGKLQFTFEGETPYRASLIGGTVLAIVVISCCVIVALRRKTSTEVWHDTHNAPWAVVGLIPMLGWWFIPAIGAWLIPRFTLIPKWVLAGLPLTVCGLWLAQAPWPAAAYPGDSPAIVLLAGISASAAYSLLSPLRRPTTKDAADSNTDS